MSIRLKLLGLLVLILISFVIIGAYALSVYNRTLASEQALRDKTNKAVELANHTESLFHSQLNSWKNVLLRGSDTGSYHKYLAGYYQHERDTRKSIEQLHELVINIDNENIHTNELLVAHLQMGRKFREAIRLFNSTDVNAGRVTDLYVVKEEETPSKLLTNLIIQLEHNRTKQLLVLDEKRQLHETSLFATVIGLLVVSLVSFLWLVDKNIAKPAEKATALADIIQHAERVAKFGTWDWDSKFDSHYWSESLFNMLGIDESQQPSLDLFITSLALQDRAPIRQLIEDAQQNEKSFECEAKIQQNDGNEIIVLLRGQVSKESHAGKIRMTSIVYDITERIKTRNQITQSESRYKTLFENSGDAIIVMVDGHFTDANPQAMTMFGCTREDLIGKSPLDFSPTHQYDGRTSIEVAQEKIYGTLAGEPQLFPWSHIKLNGSPFDAEVILNQIVLDGQPCIQCIVRDITVRKRTEEAIKNIATGVSARTGEDFFEQLVIYLSKLFETKYAFIGLLDEDTPDRVNTLCISIDGEVADNISYSLIDTPCANVINEGMCAHATGVQEAFPKDKLLQDMEVDSYIGTPLYDATNKPVGLIVLLDNKPLQQSEWLNEILEIFAARAGAELERVRAEKIINKQGEQLRASIEAMPGIFYMFNSEGYIVQYNKGYKEMFNLSDHELEHLHGLAVIHPEDRAQGEAAMNEVFQYGKTVQIELRVRTNKKLGKNSPIAYMLATGSRVYLDNKPYLVGAAIDVSERVMAQEELYLKGRAMEAATEGMVLTDAINDNKIVYANHSMEILTGYERNELIGKNPRMFQGANTDNEIATELKQAIHSHMACQVELLNYRKDGSEFWNKITITPVQNDSGETTHYIGTQLDVTDRRTTEEALRRSQKMEAIGQLAGGVAHDFNNQLGIVIGYLDFLHEHLADQEKASQWVDTATQATLRCTDLTRQLLNFSRRSTSEKSVSDLNQELEKMDTLISRTITPAITVQIFPSENLWPTSINAGEFQDAILNLVINARDAMPDGGQLIIETTNKHIDEQTAELNPELKPGDYVQVMVSDTGEGMDKSSQERIFEPFYTTKGEGKGTGLGLAMVYGFTKRFNGDIKVYSEPTIGTTFRLCLPRVIDPADKPSEQFTSAAPAIGKETILIVDDEVDLLKLAEKYLDDLGYQVYTAINADEALNVLKQHSNIDLLFSDVVMPGTINGYALAEAAEKILPDIKVLLTSGFTSNTMAVNGQAKFTNNLLHKPYRQNELAQSVRHTLDNEAHV